MQNFLKLILVLLISFSAPSNASFSTFIEKDLVYGSGDNKITFDTRTGLEWLDFSESKSISPFAILNDYHGFLSQGFRYANQDEVSGLLVSANIYTSNIPNDPIFQSTSNQITSSINLFNLIQLTGHTSYSSPFLSYDDPGQLLVYGIFKYANPFIDTNYSTYPYTYPAAYWRTIRGQAYNAGAYPGTSDYGLIQDFSVGDAQIASFLVRDASPVPLSPSVWLFGSTLFAFCYNFKNKNK